jgi:hypothetical protein
MALLALFFDERLGCSAETKLVAVAAASEETDE